MVISQACDSVMMFTDRLFLSRLGEAYLSGCMTGGLTAFMFSTVFFGVISYANALVAQYYGAQKYDKCPLAAMQGIFLAVLSYPVIVGLIPVGIQLFALADHTPLQERLETQYYVIVSFGMAFGLIRVGLGSFFSGIGRTRIVMAANVVAMFVNVFNNYVLIFGKFGLPKLGMNGAAIGSVLGSAVGAILLAIVYFHHRYHQQYRTRSSIRFDWWIFRKLIRFGWPAGIEIFLNVAAFNLIVQMFHSYGSVYAAAMTITFNWDLLAFIPMIGVRIATTSLTGRYMGARSPDLANKSAKSGIFLAYLYAGFMMLLFVFVPHLLVRVFSGGEMQGSYREIAPIASTMLRLAAVYTWADATYLVLGGALRGAGDTHWAMRASVLLHWCNAGIAFLLIKVFQVQPLVVWGVFVLFAVLMGIAFMWRWSTGKWRTIEMLGDEDAANVGDRDQECAEVVNP
jgi:MATE family multidrug resistance protein